MILGDFDGMETHEIYVEKIWEDWVIGGLCCDAMISRDEYAANMSLPWIYGMLLENYGILLKHLGDMWEIWGEDFVSGLSWMK